MTNELIKKLRMICSETARSFQNCGVMRRKNRKILSFFSAIVLLFTASASAIAPIYYAAALVGALTCVLSPPGPTEKKIYAYASKGVGFLFKNSRAITYKDWAACMDGDIESAAYAIPEGSKNGVGLILKTPARDVAKQIIDNPSAYPSASSAIRDAAGSAAVSPGYWGTGDDFDISKTPAVGDWLALPNGTNRPVTQISQCQSMSGDTYNPTVTNVQSRAPGASGCRNSSCSVYQIWGGCGHISSSGKTTYGKTYTLGSAGTPPVNDVTDEQLVAALQANPAEVVQAQQDLYRSKNGGQQLSGNKFPAASGGGTFVYPGTNQEPTVPEIIGAVQAADEATSDTNPVQPDSAPPTTTTTTTTTTRTQGQVTVDIDPETGARTVTIPTTIVTRDGDGNVISTQDEIFVGTYPQGATLPQHVQDAISGAADSTSTTEEKTTKAPPNLATPELLPINWDPLLVGLDALQDRFPFSLLAGVEHFLDSFYAAPVTPHFTMVIANEEFDVSLELLDSFAELFRNIIRSIALALTAYLCLEICMR